MYERCGSKCSLNKRDNEGVLKWSIYLVRISEERLTKRIYMYQIIYLSNYLHYCHGRTASDQYI